MVWTTPKTFTSGERLFAQDLNIYVSDNLTDLDTRVQAIPAAPTALQFDTVATITATDASWSVPTLADPVVKVTVIGAGGGGGSSNGPNPPGNGANGSAGTGSTFACSAGTVTAGGGFAGKGARQNSAAPDAQYANTSANGGVGATIRTYEDTGGSGGGGEITVAYLDMTGVTTANVTIGAGGAGGTISGAYPGGDGFDGVVIFEYRAG